MNHKYDLCSEEPWMLNKPEKTFMRPMKVCLPCLISYICHTQLYARMWRYRSSYSKLFDLCVWILFMWYQKLKVSCIVVFRDKELTNLLERCWIRKARPIPWPGRSCEFTLLGISWSNVREHFYIQTLGILLTERHTEIERVLTPALFLYCRQL